MTARVLHVSVPHESGHLHVTGTARYVADLSGPPGTLVAWPVLSPHAHARILSRNAEAAAQMPGIHAVLFVEHVPGSNHWGPIQHDEPILAEDEVHYVGQIVAAVIGETEEQARAAAAAVQVEYEPLPAVLDLAGATERLTDVHVIARGDVGAALESAPIVLGGEIDVPGQDHFYLETQAALVLPDEDGTFRILSSTQHPSEVQKATATALGIGAHRVVCEVPRLGGGFGGKESQATPFAAIAAIAAQRTGRPVRMWLHRDQDMQVTGKRHPFHVTWRAGFTEEGDILGLEATLVANGGWTLDLSGPIVDRALFHCDNAYFLPTVRITGYAMRTNLPSNTAFRGFGGPQGMLVVEHALWAVAERLGLDPLAVRARNLYGPAPRDTTQFGQTVTNNRLSRICGELEQSSRYAARRAAVADFNATSAHVKRGLSFMPVKFGISFTNSLLNQAGAWVLLYTDGTVQVNHAGTEMGQGLHTKVRAVAAEELGVHPDQVRVMVTSTDKVPNTVATAASSGSDLNGAAVKDACRVLRERIGPVAAEMLGAPVEDLLYAGGQIHGNDKSVSVASVATAAWVRRIPLSAHGFYATPGVAYDRTIGRGTPFFYFAFGAAVVEVEVNGFTGEHALRRVDILHDVGDSLVPSVDVGQVEGAFVQGMGWLTMEELRTDARGRLVTQGPSTYKIPAAGDVPLDWHVRLLDRAPQPGVVGGSKAVGEPPFMLAIGVVGALRDAIAAFRPAGEIVRLTLPATPEAILRAVMAVAESGP